jgi:hypothetical protein
VSRSEGPARGDAGASDVEQHVADHCEALSMLIRQRGHDDLAAVLRLVHEELKRRAS